MFRPYHQPADKYGTTRYLKVLKVGKCFSAETRSHTGEPWPLAPGHACMRWLGCVGSNIAGRIGQSGPQLPMAESNAIRSTKKMCCCWGLCKGSPWSHMELEAKDSNNKVGQVRRMTSRCRLLGMSMSLERYVLVLSSRFLIDGTKPHPPAIKSCGTIEDSRYALPARIYITTVFKPAQKVQSKLYSAEGWCVGTQHCQEQRKN